MRPAQVVRVMERLHLEFAAASTHGCREALDIARPGGADPLHPVEATEVGVRRDDPHLVVGRLRDPCPRSVQPFVDLERGIIRSQWVREGAGVRGDPDEGRERPPRQPNTGRSVFALENRERLTDVVKRYAWPPMDGSLCRKGAGSFQIDAARPRREFVHYRRGAEVARDA